MSAMLSQWADADMPKMPKDRAIILYCKNKQHTQFWPQIRGPDRRFFAPRKLSPPDQYSIYDKFVHFAQGRASL